MLAGSYSRTVSAAENSFTENFVRICLLNAGRHEPVLDLAEVEQWPTVDPEQYGELFGGHDVLWLYVWEVPSINSPSYLEVWVDIFKGHIVSTCSITGIADISEAAAILDQFDAEKTSSRQIDGHTFEAFEALLDGNKITISLASSATGDSRWIAMGVSDPD